jgi:hypothetical protein
LYGLSQISYIFLLPEQYLNIKDSRIQAMTWRHLAMMKPFELRISTARDPSVHGQIAVRGQHWQPALRICATINDFVVHRFVCVVRFLVQHHIDPVQHLLLSVKSDRPGRTLMAWNLPLSSQLLSTKPRCANSASSQRILALPFLMHPL